MISDHPAVEYVGHLATFYIPEEKLATVEVLCHDFFIENYDAYTCEKSDIQGFWRKTPGSRLFKDRNVKYVVSFQGNDRVHAFVDFLSRLCSLVGEESIYLTVGHEAWLVKPHEQNREIPPGNH